MKIPSDWPVRPLRNFAKAKDPVTCGTCGRSWDDAKSTSMTPTPAGRCPFEAFHEYTASGRPMARSRRRRLSAVLRSR
jgi:hypothetical protein